MDRRPIGVFDSGLGGLTVVKEIRRVLPAESIVYFGDLAHLPYGIKSKKQITEYSIQNANFLLKHRIKMLIIACNSASSAAYPLLKKRLPVPVLDVIQPAVDEAAQLTHNKRIGVIATQATIDTSAYERGLTRSLPQAELFSRACGMFVSMVEEGWVEGSIVRQIVAEYLAPLKKKSIDVLMLGCTHYPLLAPIIQSYMGKSVQLVNSAHATIHKLSGLLRKYHLQAPKSSKGRLKVFVSDKPRNFIRVGEQFLGEKLSYVKVIRPKS